MMGKAITTLIVLVIIAGLVYFFSAAYIVNETEQVIITQFGKPVGDTLTEPGLHFKTPFIQDVKRFEKRIMEWDGNATQIPTKDKRFIWVDSTARWRIVDPLTFFKAVREERQAQSRLDDILDSATHQVISSQDLIESVRSTNRQFEVLEDAFRTEYDVSDYTIEVGRHKIGQQIKKIADPKLKELGIELVDIRLRRIHYVEDVRRKVYERMISERKRMAEFFRSEGLGKQMEIEGKKEKELKIIESTAYRQAEEIRGQADAEAARIYAETYGADPEFYAFLKTLESYEDALDQGVDLILSTDSDFFRFLKTMGESVER